MRQLNNKYLDTKEGASASHGEVVSSTPSPLVSQQKDEIMKFIELKRGDKVSYTKDYKFGKRGTATATVVMIKGQTALLDSGDNISKYKRVEEVKNNQSNIGCESKPFFNGFTVVGGK